MSEIIEKKCADMLRAFAAARNDPSLRMKRNDVVMGVDICVAVDAETGDFADKEGVVPDDPKTWPFVVMLFGSDQQRAHDRLKERAEREKRGEETEKSRILSTCSRFYVWDPFAPSPESNMVPVGETLRPGVALVKVAERQTSLKAV